MRGRKVRLATEQRPRNDAHNGDTVAHTDNLEGQRDRMIAGQEGNNRFHCIVSLCWRFVSLSVYHSTAQKASNKEEYFYSPIR